MNLKKSYKLKLLLIIFVLTTSLIILVRQQMYPIRLLESTGYLFQIPFYYWGLLSVAIGSLYLYNVFKRSPFYSLISTIVFFLILGSYHYLFRGTAGGGFSAERVTSARINSHITTDIYGSGQFSQVPVLQRLQYLVIETNHDLLDAVELGFLLYIVLFSVALWSFAYFNNRDPFSAFSGVCLLFVITLPLALRFRFVPQFFALSLLIFLYAIHIRAGWPWFIMKVILFAALVHSHAMFFLYYLVPVVLYPVIQGFLMSLRENSLNQLLLYSIRDIATRPIPFVIGGVANTIRSYRNPTWTRLVTVLITIYFLFYLFNFDRWQQRIFTLFASPDLGGSATLLARYLGVEVDRELRYESVPTELQFHLTSIEMTIWTTRLTMSIVVGGLVLLAVGSLLRNTSSYQPFHLAVAVAAGVHFLGGLLLPIHGRRALQVLFIPFMFSITIIKRNQIALVLMFIILVSSPILAMNTMNNAELTGADRQPDFFSEEAGEALEEVKYDVLIRQSGERYNPVDLTGSRNHVGITEVLPGLEPRYGSRYMPQKGDLILFDHRLEHKTSYYLHECNYEEMDIIYDNTNEILHIGQRNLECESVMSE